MHSTRKFIQPKSVRDLFFSSVEDIRLTHRDFASLFQPAEPHFTTARPSPYWARSIRIYWPIGTRHQTFTSSIQARGLQCLLSFAASSSQVSSRTAKRICRRWLLQADVSWSLPNNWVVPDPLHRPNHILPGQPEPSDLLPLSASRRRVQWVYRMSPAYSLTQTLRMHLLAGRCPCYSRSHQLVACVATAHTDTMRRSRDFTSGPQRLEASNCMLQMVAESERVRSPIASARHVKDQARPRLSYVLLTLFLIFATHVPRLGIATTLF